MSGVAGADRIERKNFDKVMQDYFIRVIKPQYPSATIKPSGSYISNLSKQDFGDMDLILTLPGDDKKQVKLELQKYLESLPSDIIMPFKNPKYKGKRSYNAGELVSVMYPQGDGKSVQIDNMVALSQEEADFKSSFLDLPAEKQGLVLGLVKIACIEHNPSEIFARLGLRFPTNIQENQEYEFNLSGQSLTLRLITYEPGTYKEIERQELWKSNQWSDVEKLLSDYDLSLPFESLLKYISGSLKNPRSKNRIYGVFKSMITVKSGEVGTPKGEAKEKALQDIKTTLNLSETVRFLHSIINEIIKEYKSEKHLNEQKGEVIAFLPGSFKPPHKGHLNLIKEVSNIPGLDRLTVLISQPVKNKRSEITAREAKLIFEIYSQNESFGCDVNFEESQDASPVTAAYKYLENNQFAPNSLLYFIVSDAEAKRFPQESLEKYANKNPTAPKVQARVIPATLEDSGEKVSASAMRAILENPQADKQQLKRFMPDSLSEEDKQLVIDILTKHFVNN